MGSLKNPTFSGGWGGGGGVGSRKTNIQGEFAQQGGAWTVCRFEGDGVFDGGRVDTECAL